MTRDLHISACNRSGATRARRRGFTFTEVLFAVVILGVGFIMLAAIFPVALSQTRQSADESSGAEAASSAMAQVAAVFDGSDWNLSSVTANSTWPFVTNAGMPIDESLPATMYDASSGQAGMGYSASYNASLNAAYPRISVRIGQVHALGVNANPNNPTNAPTAIPAIRLNEILPSNPRIAWVVFYRRDEVLSYVAGATAKYVPSPYAMVICVPLSIGANSQFNGDPNTPQPGQSNLSLDLPPESWSYTFHNLQPQLVKGTIGFASNSTSQFLLATAPANSNGVDGQPWTEGTYVIVADDKDTSQTPCPGLFNGHIYRIGGLASVNAGFRGRPQYYLMPGWDFTPETGINVKTGLAQPRLGIGVSNTGARTGDACFYMIGRYYQSNGLGGRYIGPSQEVGAFMTMVKCQ
jgi:prepilin-type N-terminal cleavage/methylation domain-containing protein